MTVAEGTGLGSRMTAYRWHLVDPVPFQKSLKFEIEHKGWTFNADGAVKSGFGERVDLMSSVAFWYQDGIALDQPPVPYGAARLPQGNALQIEVERSMSQITTEKGQASMFPDLFWSKDVVVFEGEGPGSKMTIPFDVPEDGDYELYAQFAKGSNYGVYTVLLDGKPPVAPVLEHEPGADVRPQTQFDGYALETYVGADYQVGWPRLTKGRHTLTFECLGKREDSSGYVVGVDDIVLAKTGPAAWAAAAKIQEPRTPTGSVADLAKALSDPDPVTRGLAAMALVKEGPKAQPALPAADGGAQGPGPQRPHDVRQRDRGDRQGRRARGAGPDGGLLGQGRADPRAAGLRRGARRDRQARGDPGAAVAQGAREDAASALVGRAGDQEHRVETLAPAPLRGAPAFSTSPSRTGRRRSPRGGTPRSGTSPRSR